MAAAMESAPRLQQAKTWLPPGKDERKGGAVAAAGGGRYGHIATESPTQRRAQERSASLSEDPKLREMKRHIGQQTRTGWTPSKLMTSMMSESETRTCLPVGPSSTAGAGGYGKTPWEQVGSAAGTHTSGPFVAQASAAGDTYRSDLGGSLRRSGGAPGGWSDNADPAGSTAGLPGKGTASMPGVPGKGVVTGVGAATSSRGGGMAKSISQPEIGMIKSYLSMASGAGNFGGLEAVDRMMENIDQAATTNRRRPSKYDNSNSLPLQDDIANTLRSFGRDDVDRVIKRIASEGAISPQPRKPDYSVPFSKSPVREEKVPDAELRRATKLFDVHDAVHARNEYRSATDRALRRLLSDVNLARGPGLEDSGQDPFKMVDGIHKFYRRECSMEDGLPEVKPEPSSPSHLRYSDRVAPLPGSLRADPVPDKPIIRKPKAKRKTVAEHCLAATLLRSRSAPFISAAMETITNHGRLNNTEMSDAGTAAEN